MSEDNTQEKAAAPAKTLVLCFDGTSNQFREKNTNVIKLCGLLDKNNPDNQMVYYQPGIGTYTSVGPFSSFGSGPTKIIDLMTAWHVDYLSEHVCGGYEFLMETYRPGDKIVIFGFSRGAYTARVLAAMLYKVGLLPRLNKELVQFAWDLYKKSDDVSKNLSVDFRRTFSREVTIQFVGVWDSVSSIGLIPEFLPYTAFNPAVLVLRHALALDERRIKFRANFWTNSPPSNFAGSIPTDVKEVWFSGCHSDIGGGKEVISPSLSDIPLRWMVRQCHETDCGIIFDQQALNRARIPLSLDKDDSDLIYREEEDSKSSIHDEMSWKAPWWYIFELIPMRRHLRDNDGNWKPRPTIRLNLSRGRDVWSTLGIPMVHSSVRIRRESMGYKPKASLPQEFVYVD